MPRRPSDRYRQGNASQSTRPVQAEGWTLTRYDRDTRYLAAALSALAGFVDAAGFIASGGFFVSFMSGNSTRMSVGVAQGSTIALVAGLILLAFLSGATAGSLIGRFFRSRRRAMVLAFVTALLIGAAGCFSRGGLCAGLMFAASAMGAENAVFEENGEIRIGLTYMTGTLAKAGQRLADAISGGDAFGWAPYLAQWFALVIGSVAGAACFARFGLGSFWLAAIAAGGLCRTALWLERRGKGLCA